VRCVLRCFHISAAIILLTSASVNLRADSVWLVVDHVSFTAGGTVDGYFEYDGQTNDVADWNIATTAAGEFSGFAYTTSDSAAATGNAGCSFLFESNPSGQTLCLDVGAPSLSGDYTVLTTSTEVSSAGTRHVAAGGFLNDPQQNPGAAVPEPSTITLGPIGLTLLLGLLALSRRSSAQIHLS